MMQKCAKFAGADTFTQVKWLMVQGLRCKTEISLKQLPNKETNNLPIISPTLLAGIIISITCSPGATTGSDI